MPSVKAPRTREPKGLRAESPVSEPLAPACPDRILREAECERVTGLSRQARWKLEHAGDFPFRRKLTSDGFAVGWLQSEILEWLHSREIVSPSSTEGATDAPTS